MGNVSVTLPVLAQAAQQGARKVAEEAPLLSPWLTLFLVVLLLGVPFLLGSLIARWLKMKETATKIGVVLLSLELGLAPFISQYVIGALEEQRYEQELTGWQKKEAAREKISSQDIEELVKAVPSLTRENVQWEPPASQIKGQKKEAGKTAAPTSEKTSGKTTGQTGTGKKPPSEKTTSKKTTPKKPAPANKTSRKTKSP